MMIGKFIPIGGDESLSYRKEFNVKTMKAHGANGYVGLREDGEAYHVYTKYWRFECACDGEGLPPAGVECEGYFPAFGTNRFEWQECLILWRFEKECAVKSLHSSTLHYCDEFRPIRTEAERKREAAVIAMREFFGHASGLYNLSGLYEEIASGKIPGVRLADD
ncbi:hypothetical protein [Erwinia aphidicola]|uniref:hypothetical protein n=1 Tax=Erwinia aphidicola TaxID=68334 RepID=UPI003D233F83